MYIFYRSPRMNILKILCIFRATRDLNGYIRYYFLKCKIFPFETSIYMNMYQLTTTNFEEFYMDHFDEFLSFTMSRVSDKDIAIDICQECFIKTLEHLHRGVHIEIPRGYVYTLLRNRIIDFYRKKKTVSLDDYTETGGDIPNEEKPTDRIYYQKLIDRLGQLPDTYRDIIIMRFVMDLSVTDIAERLGIPENTVSVRIFRGKELAMQLLSEFKE